MRTNTTHVRNHNVLIVALVIVAVGMIGFLAGLFYGGAVELNTAGASKGIAACAGPAQGGVYVNTAIGQLGTFEGCDF